MKVLFRPGRQSGSQARAVAFSSAQLRDHDFQRSQDGNDIEEIEVSEVGNPEDPPFEAPLSPRDLDAKPLFEHLDQVGSLNPRGRESGSPPRWQETWTEGCTPASVVRPAWHGP